jgi:hypothetical protein
MAEVRQNLVKDVWAIRIEMMAGVGDQKHIHNAVLLQSLAQLLRGLS